MSPMTVNLLIKYDKLFTFNQFVMTLLIFLDIFTQYIKAEILFRKTDNLCCTTAYGLCAIEVRAEIYLSATTVHIEITF